VGLGGGAKVCEEEGYLVGGEVEDKKGMIACKLLVNVSKPGKFRSIKKNNHRNKDNS
jgi:hypothetical protein